jgi:branched-subunit amino acid aminotransferase/4-amino-4-deoxychorismate lyase
MFFEEVKKIWMDGKLVDRDQATVSILAHVIHYGSSIFEGIRAYNTPDGPAVFRLPEHLERLYNSCRIYRMEIPFTRKQLLDATLETLRLHDRSHRLSHQRRHRGLRHGALLGRGCQAERGAGLCFFLEPDCTQYPPGHGQSLGQLHEQPVD